MRMINIAMTVVLLLSATACTLSRTYTINGQEVSKAEYERSIKAMEHESDVWFREQVEAQKRRQLEVGK